MVSFARGRYEARFAASEAEVAAALRLRARLFRGDAGASDRDASDARCRHLIVREVETGALAGCARVRDFACGAEIGDSYAARFYDLSRLAAYPAPMVELGRFCIDPEIGDLDALRVAWGAVAAHVEAQGAGMLFGCSSFAGVEAAPFENAFAFLSARHLAPPRWSPRVKAPRVVRYAQGRRGARADLRAGRMSLPPLLRSYLAMGAWVSDHAVIDEDLGTLHVFTGVEVAAVPAARARALRAG